jgi:hypothetical protein
MQHARSTAINQRLLRNQLFGKMKIEVGNQHSRDYRRGQSNAGSR